MRDKSNWVIFGGLLAGLVCACALSLFAGAVRVPADEMFTCDIIQLRVHPIIQLRMARILLAIVAGAGLSVSGVVFQALFRNPLAEPYVLGVSSGAGLAAVAAILLSLSASSTWTLPALAFTGALATILLVYALARDRAGATPVHTLLLSGVMVNAVFGSMLMFLVSLSSSDELHNVIWWLLGNLQIFDWALLRAAAIVVGAGLLATTVLSRDLNVITLGEEPAAHLGLNVERTKKLFLLLASLMTGATVAACGLIGFVGLIVPHSMRLALGPDHRRLVPASALGGAVFLVLADSLARTVIAPMEVPIGVVTALLGGPFFFFLLRHKKHSSWG
ncbi:MAG: iron ABC transporter permease [Planctomycetota bacterium]